MRVGPEYSNEPKITKTFLAFAEKNKAKIEDFYADSDGVWIHLKNGWCDHHGAHTVRGDNASLAIARFKDVVMGEK